ncbi:hypothetical protein HBI56_148110 [Parastagonospora nodorum]|nr:hypothetical protein HBI56_148110 [Parastagonospora nodorum]
MHGLKILGMQIQQSAASNYQRMRGFELTLDRKQLRGWRSTTATIADRTPGDKLVARRNYGVFDLEISYETTLNGHNVAFAIASNTEFRQPSFNMHITFHRPLQPRTFYGKAEKAPRCVV